jgi:hypothetical protein
VVEVGVLIDNTRALFSPVSKVIYWFNAVQISTICFLCALQLFTQNYNSVRDYKFISEAPDQLVSPLCSFIRFHGDGKNRVFE